MSTMRLESGFFEDALVSTEEVIYTEGQDTWVRKNGELFRKPGNPSDPDTLLGQLHSVSSTESWEELAAKGQSFFTITTDTGFYHVAYFTEANKVVAVFTKAKKGSPEPELNETIRTRSIL